MWHTGHVLNPISCSNPQPGCVSSLITDHHCIYPRPSYLTEHHALTAPLEAGAYVLAYLTDSSLCNRPCYVGSTLREPLYDPSQESTAACNHSWTTYSAVRNMAVMIYMRYQQYSLAVPFCSNPPNRLSQKCKGAYRESKGN